MNWKLTAGLTVAGAALTWIGVTKAKELRAIQLLSMNADKNPFQISRVSGQYVEAVLNLIITNPTDYRYRIDQLNAVMNSGDSGAYLASISLFSTMLPAREKTAITIPVRFSLKQLLELTTKIFFASKSVVLVNGTVTYVSSGLAVPVPFSFSLDVKEQLNSFFKLQNIPVQL